MSAVTCVDLCKTYRQGEENIKALDHVSIEIDEGGFVCLSAPSGGGKTTLLNAIGGLDRPDSGQVTVNGQRIDNLSKGELAELRLRKIGFVFQAFNLIPVLTARENVEFVMQVQGGQSGDSELSKFSRKSAWPVSRIDGRRTCLADSSNESRLLGR